MVCDCSTVGDGTVNIFTGRYVPQEGDDDPHNKDGESLDIFIIKSNLYPIGFE